LSKFSRAENLTPHHLVVFEDIEVIIMQFSYLVDEIQKLSFEEKQELQNILQKYLVEEKREKIYLNYQNSQSEWQQGKLKFSSNINELKEILEEE